AWTGEPFTWRGRTIRVTPAPPSPPMMLIGGSTPKAARRAARLPAGFFPAIGDPAPAEIYPAGAERGRGGAPLRLVPGGPGFVHVSEDPERDWKVVGPHALYDSQTYESWQPPGQRSEVCVNAHTIDDLKRSGVYQVLTPDECVALARESGRVILHPLMGGLSPEFGWQGLKLFERAVLPRL